MTKPKKRVITTPGIIYLSLFVAFATVILVFSAFSGEISSSQSNFVVDILNSILRFFGVILNESQLDTFAFFVRKIIGHFLIFLLDGIFAYLMLINLSIMKKKWLPVILAISLMIMIAGSSELIQLFTSGRSGNFYDVGIDLSGAMLGVATAFLVTLSRKEKAEHSSAS